MAEARKALRGRFIREKVVKDMALFQAEKERGPQARILYYHLHFLADSDGRFLAEPSVLVADAFPCGQRSRTQVSADLKCLAERGLIRLYEAQGQTCGHFPTWYEDQPRPDPRRYLPSELPAPPDFASSWHVRYPQSAVQSAVQSAGRVARESHASGARVARQKRADAFDVDVGSDLKVQDGKTQDVEVLEPEKPVPAKKLAPTTAQPIVVHHVHDTLMAKIGHKPESLPYARMGKFIVRLLKTRTPDQVNAVWDHWLASEDGWAKQHAWSWQQFEPNFDAVELALKEGRPYGQRANRGGSKRMEAAGEGDFGPGGEVDWDTALGTTLPGV